MYRDTGVTVNIHSLKNNFPVLIDREIPTPRHDFLVNNYSWESLFPGK